MIDISWPISNEMTEYKNRKSVQIRTLKTILNDNVFESELTFHSHTGTHIDAPAHFLKNGAPVDHVSFDSLIGTCRVLDCSHLGQVISASDLSNFAIESGERILLKTKNSTLDSQSLFDASFAYLNRSAAEYLVSKKLKTIGIDYLGIERNQPQHETHTVLMSASITIIEGLRLANVIPGNYELICLPLLILGVDAAPARAILRKY